MANGDLRSGAQRFFGTLFTGLGEVAKDAPKTVRQAREAEQAGRLRDLGAVLNVAQFQQRVNEFNFKRDQFRASALTDSTEGGLQQGAIGRIESGAFNISDVLASGVPAGSQNRLISQLLGPTVKERIEQDALVARLNRTNQLIEDTEIQQTFAESDIRVNTIQDDIVNVQNQLGLLDAEGAEADSAERQELHGLIGALLRDMEIALKDRRRLIPQAFGLPEPERDPRALPPGQIIDTRPAQDLTDEEIQAEIDSFNQ